MNLSDLWLSIDPGTHAMGVVLWQGERPGRWSHWQWPQNTPVEDRLAGAIKAMNGLLMEHPVISAIACEWPAAAQPYRQSPELQTLVRRLRQWARLKSIRWHSYNPSTVRAAVRLRGVRTGDPKQDICWGVAALYPQLKVDSMPQDVVDAVAVGHCHLGKLIEERCCT